MILEPEMTLSTVEQDFKSFNISLCKNIFYPFCPSTHLNLKNFCQSVSIVVRVFIHMDEEFIVILKYFLNFYYT